MIKTNNSLRLIIYLIIMIAIIFTINLDKASAVSSKPNNTVKESKENIQVIPEDKPIKHIIYIVADGIEYGAFERINLPNIKGLWATGIRTNQAISTFPMSIRSITENLLTGNDDLDDGNIIKNKSNIIDIFNSTNKTTAYINNSNEELGGLTKASNILVDLPNVNNKEAVDKAIEIIKNKQPYFLGLILGNSLNSKERLRKDIYYNSLTNLDNQIGRLIYNLTEAGVYDNTMIVLVGINNYDNNSKLSKESILNSLIVRGPGIKSGENIPVIRLKDVMPTIDFLSYGKATKESNANVIWNIVKKQGYTEEYLMKLRISDMNNEQIDDYYSLLKMKENKRDLLIQQNKVKEEKKLIKDIINEKNREIKKIKSKLNILKIISLAFLILFFAGFFIEYYILRKRFLLF